MKLTKHHREPSSRMNMTPMIDIVFLLIIFFMTVTQVSEINKERLELPKQAGSEDQKPSVLTVNITESGEMIVSGRPVTLDDLLAIVGEELTKVGDDPSRINVVFRIDRRSECRQLNEAVIQLKRLQINKVRYGVEVPE